MAIPSKGINIIKRTIAAQSKSTDKLLSGLDIVERAILRAIMGQINRMSAGPDGIRFTKGNAKILTALRKRIKNLTQTDAYKNAVKEYADSFGILSALAIDKHDAINGVNVPKSFFTDIRQFSLTQAEKQLLGEGLQAGFVDNLMNRINTLVATGADFGHIQAELEAQISGASGLTSYVRQISTDTINQFNGALDQKVAKEFGYEWIVYSGSVIKTTRCQCAKWVNLRYLHKSQLQKEINWAKGGCSKCGSRKCSGMIPATTPSTFSIYRGGYNCRHNATWIDSALVPADKMRLFEKAA